MRANLSQTAVLFFTKSVASEATSKLFVSAGKRSINHKVSSLLISNTRRTALSANLAVFEITDDQQTGNTFGQRLTNAIDKVFKKDFENVIVIGNDCPQLTSKLISTAERQLQTHPLVFGPDQHGGVYLLGINRNFFDRENFANRLWQTPGLLKDLQITYAEARPFLLPELNDVNNFDDLKELLPVLPSLNKIKALVASFIASFQENVSHPHLHYRNPAFFVFGMRAPPIY